MRDYPKWVMEFRTSSDDDSMTPIQAGLQALLEMREPDTAVTVYDVDSDRHWDVRFRDHVLEIVELRRLKLKLPGME